MTRYDHAGAFGDAADRYAAVRPTYPEAFFERLLVHVGDRRRRAVDLGAGSGQASVRLARSFDEVIAIEPDARMLERLPGTPRIRGVNTSAETAELEEGSADAVIAATSFHWMDQDRVCQRVAGWLRPGGVFFPFLYGPFVVEGPGESVFRRHRALWGPYRDARLGTRVRYGLAIDACPGLERIESMSASERLVMSAARAAALLASTSFASAYAREREPGGRYQTRLAEELAAEATHIGIRMSVGGVIARRRVASPR